MDDPESLNADNWEQLKWTWETSQEGWHDSTSDYFQRYFWEEFEQEIRAYNDALSVLLDELRGLRSVVGDY